ncbi:hypothetical protein Y1Q_0000153 [Alligator mississippiensis]|uniref:Uncharacterized protein n=1 Tax=Alligator mississippiensis TaxID=8496 RepID=A0A151MLU6_ALLMI|nr:hypothetical protein Y1Q_0000153 [Alligator mississippiensis]
MAPPSSMEWRPPSHPNRALQTTSTWPAATSPSASDWKGHETYTLLHHIAEVEGAKPQGRGHLLHTSKAPSERGNLIQVFSLSEIIPEGALQDRTITHVESSFSPVQGFCTAMYHSAGLQGRNPADHPLAWG